MAETGATSYLMNPSTVEEAAIEVGGVSAETNTSGILDESDPQGRGCGSSSSTICRLFIGFFAR